ncbi:MAG TPA: hypothetical protein PLD95_00985 [bacterium]|nr:hypothetical protein [bacterium]HOG38029.1 hypothetical protein [bacterium]
MKNKTLIILFAIIVLALIAKFGLRLYSKISVKNEEQKPQITENTIEMDSIYNFSFDNVNYEFLTLSDQVIEKSSTGKIGELEDKYVIKKDDKELMSLTFLPKETEKFLDQSYASYLEESLTINDLSGSVYKDNGKSIAYLLRGEKYNYLWINNDYDNFDNIVKTFKQQ